MIFSTQASEVNFSPQRWQYGLQLAKALLLLHGCYGDMGTVHQLVDLYNGRQLLYRRMPRVIRSSFEEMELRTCSCNTSLLAKSNCKMSIIKNSI